ncbi:MAG: hypothetical protein J1F64_07550 [Oscillospiraceae bacterium]|nr:hypothetical protein [Oscillospiraceae bacterium]
MDTGWREFRYQTGEADEFVPVLRRDGIIQADVDFLPEIDIYKEKLKAYGITPDPDAQIDFDALDKEENPEFYARYTFLDTDGKRLLVDIFHIEEPEETYASVDFD